MCDSTQVVETASGQALADELSVKFFETSAKADIGVIAAFESLVNDIKTQLLSSPNFANPSALKLKSGDSKPKKDACVV